MIEIKDDIIGTYTIWNASIPNDKIIYAFTYCFNNTTHYNGHKFYVEEGKYKSECTKCGHKRDINIYYLQMNKCEVYYWEHKTF